MADRIKGITIEIGGDTTKLSSALKDVNKEIKNTQSDLRDVEKLLKLDPGNTELLTQKQQLLAKAVDDTKDKLQKLKDAQAQMNAAGVDKSSAEYQALEREIIDCEQALKKLEKAARESNVTLQKVADAGKKLQSVGSSVEAVGREVSKASAIIATGMGTAVKTTMDFDTAMSQVKSLVKGITEDEFEQLRNKAREMGKETRFSATEAAEGLSYMALAGWNTEEMLAGIEPVLNLAIASGTELGTTSDIVTDSLSAFGLTAQDTAHFVDVLAETSRSSNTNVEMLGESFKYAGTLAGGMNMSVDDIALALGIMANNGIKSTQAGTSLRGVLTRLAKPTKESAAAMEELGIEIVDSDGKVKSMKQILDELRTAFNMGNGDVEGFKTQLADLDAQFASGSLSEEEYADAIENLAIASYGAEGAERLRLATMLAGKNALSGFLALVNSSEKDYNDLANSIANSTGAAEEMRLVMSDNLGGDLDQLKSSLQELAISFGDVLIPPLREFIEKVQELVDKFNGMSEWQKRLITGIGMFIVALGPVLVILGKLMIFIGLLMQYLPVIAPVIAAIVGAVGLIPLAIAAVIAAIVVWIKNWDDIKLAAQLAMELLVERIQMGVEKIKTGISNFINWFREKFPWLSQVIDLFIDNMKNKFNNFVTIVKGAIETVKGLLSGQLKFPDIKMPHFSFQGKFSLNPPSVPKFKVEWYKKAYDDAYLLNSPTIFGAAGGQLLGGGEGNGSEAVVGTDKLMSMISEVVGNQSVTVVLEGDAQGVFNLVRTENSKFMKSNGGYSPLASY